MSLRRCSECGNPIVKKGPTAKTCDDKCRAKRSRRLKKARADGGRASAMPEHQQELAARAEGEIQDAVKDVARAELVPVVRAAITEDTLRAIQSLVGLTPQVVSALEQDLASEDDVVRQKAYTLIIKYTMGHPAIVRAEEGTDGKQLIINFGLPRPEAADERANAPSEGRTEEPVDGTGVEIRQCDKCGADRPLADFVAGSYRCQQCYDAQQAEAQRILEETARD